jgi:hypothetical protein
MTVYKGKVTKEFIERRDQQVLKDKRDRVTAERQWDFEFPEHHLASIPTSGHKLYEGYDHDTDHEFFGACDFKHVNRFGEFHISPYIRKQLHEGKIEHIVLWKYKHKDWSRSLQEGDTVQYEVIDYIQSDEIISALNQKCEVRGFTIRT